MLRCTFVLLVVVVSACSSRHPASGDQRLLPIQLGEQFGYIDTSGKTVIPVQFAEAMPFKEDRAAIKSSGKWGYCDRTGKLVIAPQFDIAGDFRGGRAIVGVGDVLSGRKVGMIDTAGRFVIPAKYDALLDSPTDPVLSAQEGDHWGILSRDGQVLVEPRFEQMKAFRDGLAATLDDGKWGYVNSTGTFVVPPQFDRANDFEEGLAAVEVNRDHDRSSMCRDDPAFCAGKWGFIDRSGRVTIQPSYDSASFLRMGLARVEANRAQDRSANCKPEFSLTDCVGRFGFVDKTGKPVIEAKFERAWDFSEGLARVQAGKFGFIDTAGRYIVSPEYDDARDFHDGMAAVKLGGKWGFVDKNGKQTVSPQFDDADDVQDGFARVRTGPRMQYVNASGKLVP